MCELDVCLGGAVLLEVDVLAPVIGVNIVPIGGNTAVEVEVVDDVDAHMRGALGGRRL